MKVLIVGAGVAGLTLAWCLQRSGHDVTVIERRHGLGDDGYMIDFFGSGYDASEKLGLLARLESIHRPVDHMRVVGADGDTRASIPYKTVRARLFRNRHFNFMRGDLVRVLRDRVNGYCDVRLATNVVTVERHTQKTVVRLSDDTVIEADLLVGADGVHSNVRRLAFGPESHFGKAIGYTAAAFIIDNASTRLNPGRDFITFTVPNRQVSLYPIGLGRVATLFLHRSPTTVSGVSRGAPCAQLRNVYGDLQWLVPDLVDACEHARAVYFDTLEQIRMPRWSIDRVVLVGDACQCVSPLAGQGASMAVAAAYVLAEELEKQRNVGAAMLRYQYRVQPAIERQQRAAFRMARWFVPSTSLGIRLRDAITRAAIWPSVGFVMRHRMAAQSIFH
jgi:2-polyprenyl-6-methoxyphenol hydroxylase-like FAD-dependent oxidoreductase